MSGRWPPTSHASVSDAAPSMMVTLPPADDFHDPVGPDDAGGVLVDAEAEQRRVLGDDRQQPAEPVPLLEVLVDDHAGQDARGRPPSGPCAASGVAPLAPKAIMWLLIARRAGARAGDDRALPEALDDGLREARAADRRRQAQLVAAGQEDAGGVAHRARRCLVIGLRRGSSRASAGRAQRRAR